MFNVLAVILVSLLLFKTFAADQLTPQVLIPEGNFEPFFKEVKDNEKKVKKFYLDVHPVTNSQFNVFLINNPNLKKTKILKIYSDKRYLQNWSSDFLTTEEKKEMGNKPVTYVSWFVADKYCKSVGKRLPTIIEWEYASDYTNPKVFEKILKWYSVSDKVELPNVKNEEPNKYGLHDMHGVIWEWVLDFSSVMISSDSRSKGDRTDGFFCGGGSVSSLDAKSYATFMRYGFRSGLKGDYSIGTLGFRCAKDFE